MMRSIRTRRRARNQPGATLVEMIISAFVLSFLVAATSVLYRIGQKQTLIARNYSQAQTDLRTGLRYMLRTIRHGTAVSSATIASKTSGTSSIVVNVPQPGNTFDNILFYVGTDGTLYYQKSADTNPTAVVTGMSSVTFNYYKTAATTSSGSTSISKTAVNGAPTTATEVEIVLTALEGSTAITKNEGAQTTVRAYVTLRNTSWMQN